MLSVMMSWSWSEVSWPAINADSYSASVATATPHIKMVGGVAVAVGIVFGGVLQQFLAVVGVSQEPGL